MKLNIGCGNDYLEGYLNIDANPDSRCDTIHDVTKSGIPVKAREATYVYMSHFLEHVPHDRLIPFLNDLYRACANGTIIDIYVPHYTSIHAHCPQHYTYWGAKAWMTMDVDDPASKSEENYTDFRCRVLDTRLHFWSRKAGGIAKDLKLYRISMDPLWNLKRGAWQQLMERFQPFGFDEIYYKLQVVK